MSLTEALEHHAVAISGDRTWQARLRLMQALWREERGLPMGTYVPGHGPLKGQTLPLGSRIEMPYAQNHGSNFLTPAIWQRVQSEIQRDSETHPPERLIIAPRIYEDLLSSQPMCFNLFAELDEDHDLATRVVRRLWPAQVGDGQVVGIDFEWSPGRQDPQYLDNGSAFDVCIKHAGPDGRQGFIGIETKYHEGMGGKPAAMKPRYREVAEASQAFRNADETALQRQPLQQVWLDHLLALSMLTHPDEWSSGVFVLLYPEANKACEGAAKSYGEQLTDHSTFQAMTIEAVISVLRSETDAPWVTDFERRHLAMEKLAGYVAK